MRAALLPCMGDPFITAYWLRNYETWQSEVDQLVIGLINPGADVRSHITALAPHAKIVDIPTRRPHGQVMNTLLGETTADEVMFIEDDAYIRHPGVVDAAFKALSDFDVVGTLRNDDEYKGDKFAHILPCFLFARRDTLDGLWFEASLGADDIWRDTFGNASYTLRHKRLDVREGYRIEYKGASRPTFDKWIKKNPPWFHVGGLSMGYGVWLGDDVGQPPYGDDLGWDMAPRVAWWERCLSQTQGMESQRDRYQQALTRLVEQREVSRPEIDAWHKTFDKWVTW